MVANEPFDGFAVDIWALGTILFMLAFGFPPWDRASEDDARFLQFSGGHVAQILRSWNMDASDDLMDLLQGMFWRDPNQRLSLKHIRDHAWMSGPISPPSNGN